LSAHGSWLNKRKARLTNKLTVFPVVKYFKMFLCSDRQRLLDDGHGVLGCEGAVEELTGGTSLHNLCPTVARHAAEAVGTVDDVAQAMLGVGDNETAI
jgi:hypothetical protein